MKRISTTLILLFLALHTTPSRAQSPGLLRTINGSDLQVVRTANLHVSAGEPATPFVPAGYFTTTWTGELNLEARSRLYFSAEGSGELTLKIDSETVLEISGTPFPSNITERLRLNPGAIPVEITLKSPANADTRLRLYWQGRDFARESIPPQVWTHTPTPELAKATLKREGRRLFADLNCVKCHMPDDRSVNPRSSMPELSEQGPSFVGIGSRLHVSWMVDWILAPKNHRAAARMPQVELSTNEANDIAAALANFTSSNETAVPLPDPALATAGGKLFHDLQCMACHALEDEPDDLTRTFPAIALAHLNRKFKSGQLQAFLKAPHTFHPDTRMPDFQLEDDEARKLAAFLRSKAPESSPPKLLGEPIKGAELIKTRGCLNCHQYSMTNQYKAPALAAIFSADWNKSGCASAQPPVQFHLKPEDRAALHAFANTGSESLKKRSLAEYSERQFHRLQCASCHERDGEPSNWASVKALSASLHAKPEVDSEEDPHKHGNIPALTHLGDKLNPAWTEQLFAGALSYRTRSWLDARMPAFPSRAKAMARGFAQAQGMPSPTEAVEGDPAIGEKLIGITGFTCISCHGNGTTKPIAVFEGQGINFSYIHDRLTPEYYHRWMQHPQRIDAASIMPKYTLDDGSSAFTDVLDGNAAKQFDAIWNYFEQVKSKDSVE